jgi:hypothetical protein
MRTERLQNGLDFGKLLLVSHSVFGQSSTPLKSILLMVLLHYNGCLKTGTFGKFLLNSKMVVAGDLRGSDIVMTMIT